MHNMSECNCGCHGHHGDHGHHGYNRTSQHQHGCCCGSNHGIRQFQTKEEILTELEEYLEQLKAEAKGVEERIAEFK